VLCVVTNLVFASLVGNELELFEPVVGYQPLMLIGPFLEQLLLDTSTGLDFSAFTVCR
jgi:hypothetical protein